MRLPGRLTAPLVLLALATAMAVGGPGDRISFALFVDSDEVTNNAFGAQNVFPGTRTTAAFSVRDASAGGSAADTSSTHAFDDGRLRATGNWSSSFAGTRYLELDVNDPLPAGLTLSSASFSLRFASLGAGTGCFYFETRAASSGDLLATYGSTGSPVGCVTGTSQTTFSTSIAASVTSTDIANDLRVRVYGRESGSTGWNVDMATVTVTANVGSFTLYRTKLVDQATGTPSTDVWGPAVADDGYAYTTASGWGTSFDGARYVEYRFPAYVPSGSVISAAELRHSYRPQGGAASTPTYVSHTTAGHSSGAGSATVDVPAGVQDGDLLVALISMGANETLTPPTCGCWTLLSEEVPGSNRVAAYYRFASGEPASYTWTFGKSVKFSAFIAAYRNVAAIDVWDVGTGTSETTLTAPSVTTTAAGDLLLYMAGTRNGVTFTPDGSMSERIDYTASTGGGNTAVTLNEQILGAAGATGTRAATASANPNAWAAWNVAFKAASSTPDACYWFEVYEGTTLRASHGSAGSPVSCNSSTSAYASDTISLSSVDSAARANDLRIRMYFRDAAGAATLHDRVRVAITYNTP